MTDKIGMDDLAGDIFSLNIRGLRSIAMLWRKPADYFKAATDHDWQDRFTPSVRLWLSVVALTSLLQFIWIGSGSPLVEAYQAGFQEAGVQASGNITTDELGEIAAVWIFGVFPVIQMLIFLFLLPLFPLWGKGVGYSLRVRYGFAMMVPSATLMVIILPSTSFFSADFMTTFGWIIALISFLVDGQTAYRAGMPGGVVRRLFRAFGVAGLVVVLNITAHITTHIAGIFFIAYRFGVTAG